MLLRGITEDSTTRGYIKSGVYSKKTRRYITDGEFSNIVLSLKKFDEWISKSRTGDKIMYYRGFIMAPEVQKLSPTQDKTRVWKLRNHVRGANYKNLVTLVQKKHDNMDYEYWAQRL
tara:strand:- start:519 stop:869 length:351 start_codon:yes stop_codon:yes gene_type:complete